MRADEFNLSDFLPYRLSVLSSRISKALSKIYGERYGLSIPEWRVLVHVARCEKVSVREIHNCVTLEKPTVSKAVARMEQAGLLAKTTSARDQRLIEIRLTEAGFAVLEGIIPEALAFENDLLSGFSESDARQLSVLVERLHDELDKRPDAPRRSRLDVAGLDDPHD